MEDNKSLTVQANTNLSEWQLIMSQAPVVSAARMFGFQNTEQAAVVMATAYELGLPPVTALNGLVYVIDTPKGRRAALSTGGMVSLVLKSGVMAEVKITNHTDNQGEPTGCTVYMRRRDGTMEGSESFMMRDAVRADLLKKDNWSKYPADMFFARAYAKAARRYANDAVSGMYTAEELGALTDQDGVPVEQSAIKGEFTVIKDEKPAPAPTPKPPAFDPVMCVKELNAMGWDATRIASAMAAACPDQGPLPMSNEQHAKVVAYLSDQDNKAALEKQAAQTAEARQ